MLKLARREAAPAAPRLDAAPSRPQPAAGHGGALDGPTQAFRQLTRLPEAGLAAAARALMPAYLKTPKPPALEVPTTPTRREPTPAALLPAQVTAAPQHPQAPAPRPTPAGPAEPAQQATPQSGQKDDKHGAKTAGKDAGKDASKDRGKGKGTAASHGKGAANGHGKGRGKAAGGGHEADGDKVEHDDDHDTAESDPVPAIERGAVQLATTALSLAAERPDFTAPRTLQVTAKKADKLDPAMARYAEAYAGAASASHDLYTRVLSAQAQRIDAARAEAGRADALRQADLDRGLDVIERAHDHARDHLLDRFSIEFANLDAAAASARAHIEAIAAGGMARLRSSASRAQGSINAQAGRGREIEGLPAAKVKALENARRAADRGLAGLLTNPDQLEPVDGSSGKAMKAAEKEALARDVRYPVHEAGLSLDDTIKDQTKGLLAQVEPTTQNVCQALCPYVGMTAKVRGQGVKAIEHARDNSLRQLDATHRRLSRALRRSQRAAERKLALQHGAQRKRLVDGARDRARGEPFQHQAQARNGVAMLGSAAGAQGAALMAIHQRIAAQAPSGEAALAATATEASRGLLANGVPQGQAQLAGILARIEGGLANLVAVGRLASQRFRDGAGASGGSLGEDARRDETAAASQTRQGATSMEAMSKSVSDAVDGQVSSADKSFASSIGQLASSMSGIRAGLVASFDGKSAGKAGEAGGAGGKVGGGKKATDKTGSRGAVKEGADCGHCKGGDKAGAEKDAGKGGAKGGGKAKAVNAVIAEITGWGATPTEEPNVLDYRGRIPPAVRKYVTTRGYNLSAKLTIGQSEPYYVLDQLRGITATQSVAIQEDYRGRRGSDLREDVRTYLNVANYAKGVTTRVEAIRAALAYLDGNTAGGARHELNACVEWSNDSKQIDKVMKSLTPEQMKEMFDKYPEDLAKVEGDLNELDGKVFKALKAGDVPLAIALRGQVAIDEGRGAHGYAGTDAAADRIEDMYREAGRSQLSGASQFEEAEGPRSRKERSEAEWGKIQAAFGKVVGEQYQGKLDPKTGKPIDPGAALVNYATRDIGYWHAAWLSHGAIVTAEHSVDTVNAAQKRYISAIVHEHAGSPQARAARLALEATRPGGADPAKVHEATYNEETNPGLIAKGAEGGLEAAKARHEAALKKQKEMFDLAAEMMRADGTIPQKGDARQAIADKLASTWGDKKEKGDYVRSLVVNDPNDKKQFVKNTVAQLEFAMNGAGTDDDALRRTLAGLTREQYLEVKKAWQEKNHEDLDMRIGVPGHGTWFERTFESETSGDTALEMERLTHGIAITREDKAKAAAFEMYQQIRESTAVGRWIAGDEFKALDGNYKKLMGEMGATDMKVGDDGELQFVDPFQQKTPLGSFDADGNFKQRPGFTYDDLALSMTIGKQSASDFTAACDRVANGIATALTVAAAIITTIATGGAAASIWIPVLVTAAAGVAGMGIKYAIKGGRYGSEEMMFDLASTIIQAATAGIGAAAGAALRGGGKAVGALAKTWRLSEEALAKAAVGGASAVSKTLPALTLGQEMFVGALSAGLAGGANAAIGPGNIRKDNYAGEILSGILRGALGGAIGAGATKGISHISGGLGEVASRGLAAGGSGAISRVAEMGFDDIVLGRHVTWEELRSEASTAFLQNLVQGLGEGAADKAMRRISSSRAQEHDWAHEHNYEAVTAHEAKIAAREEALRRLITEELAGRGLAANDNPPPREAVPELAGRARPSDKASDKAPGEPAPAGRATGEHAPAETPAPGSAGPRTAADAAGEGLVTARVPGHEDAPEFRNGRSPLTDEPGSLRPPREGGHEPEEKLRTAHVKEDEAPPTRRTGPEPKPEPEPRTVLPKEGVNLAHGDLADKPPVKEGQQVFALDPRDPAQARQNYEVLRAGQPLREVALAYHPIEKRFMVIQGEATTVSKPPEGWVTLRHFHPGGANASLIEHWMLVLPTAFGGDFQVLRKELEYQARFGKEPMTLTSVIDHEVNGVHGETTFSITKDGDRYSLSVTLDPPVHGESKLGPFEGTHEEAMRKYAYSARDHTDMNASFGLDKLYNDNAASMSAMGEAGARRVVRGATMAENERAMLGHLNESIERADAFGEKLAGGKPKLALPEGLDARLGRLASLSDAHQAVHDLGLVQGPDSLNRLYNLLNDNTLSLPQRDAIAQIVLKEKTRAMRRSNELVAGDELIMLFHGAKKAQSESYETGGMEMTKIGAESVQVERRRKEAIKKGLPPTTDEEVRRGMTPDASGKRSAEASARGDPHDAGFALYAAQDFQSAAIYRGGNDGKVFPLFVRASELGNVIDVRSGTPLGDRWNAYLHSAEARKFGKMEPLNAAYRHLFDQAPQKFNGMAFGFSGDGRGARYEAFLAKVAADPTLPPALRAAAADPHVTLMDLGGIASTGATRDMVTDQAALHNQRLLDLYNKAYGFPRDWSGETSTPIKVAEPESLQSAYVPIAKEQTPALHPDSEEGRMAVAARRRLADEIPASDPFTQAYDQENGAYLTQERARLDPAASHPFAPEASPTDLPRSTTREEYRQADRARRLALRGIDELGLELLGARGGTTTPVPDPHQGPRRNPATLHDDNVAQIIAAVARERNPQAARSLRELVDAWGQPMKAILLAESDTGMARAIDAFRDHLKTAGLTTRQSYEIIRRIRGLESNDPAKGWGFGTARRKRMEAQNREVQAGRLAENPLPAGLPHAAVLQKILTDPAGQHSEFARRLHSDLAGAGPSDLIAQWQAHVAKLAGKAPTAESFDAYLGFYVKSNQIPAMAELTAAHLLAAPPSTKSKALGGMGLEVLKCAIEVVGPGGKSVNRPNEPGTDILGYRREDNHIVYADDKAWRATKANGGEINEVSALTTSLAANMRQDAGDLKASLARITSAGLPVDPQHARLPQRLLAAAKAIDLAFPKGYSASGDGPKRLAAILKAHQIELVVTNAASRGADHLSKPLRDAGILFVSPATPDP